MLAHQLVRGASMFANRLRAELALRGAECDGDVHLVGTPLIQSSGRIVLGRKAALISSPNRVRLTVGAGGAVFIEEGAIIGSGTRIVARGTIRIGAGAVVGPSCVISDADCAHSGSATGIVVGAGARLSARVTLLDGAVVPMGARIARDTVVRASELGPDAASMPEQVATDELLHRLRSIVGAVVPSVGDIALDEDMKLASGWDSLSAIHVLVAVESEFGVVLPSSFFERARTLETIATAVTAALVQADSPPSGIRDRAGI